MSITMSRVKKLLILPIIVSILYFAVYLILIFTGTFIEHHQAFLAGILSLFALNIIFFAAQENNRLLLSASIIVSLTALFDLVYHQLSPHVSHSSLNVADFIIHTFLSFGLILLTAGIYFELKRKLKERALLNLFAYMNQLLYFEYNEKLDHVHIEFSENFVKTYSLTYEKLDIDYKTFANYVHDNDRHLLFDNATGKIRKEYDELEFRIQYPDMKEYITMYTKVVKEVEDKFVTIDVDITPLQKLQTSLDEHEKNLYYKTLEEKYILTNTSDYICKMSLNGEFIFASPSYAKIYGLTAKSIVGKHFDTLNKTQDKILREEKWYKDLLVKGYSADQTGFEINGKTHYISWRNDVIKNEHGDIEAIIVIGHDISDLVNLKNTLEHQNKHDDLTGLLNRKGFIETLQETNGFKHAVIVLIDLHQFASINEYYGTDTGDAILMNIAEKLKNDLTKDCVIARYSGDEFALVHPSHSPLEIKNVIKKIIKSTQNLYKDIEVRKNIGYSVYPEDGTNWLECLGYASMAANEVKRNKALISKRFEGYMHEALKDNIMMANDLRKAIEQDVFEVHFQPIYDVNTQAIVSLEALTRWPHKDHGMIYPANIFPVAMEAGLSTQLDYHIIQKSLGIFKELKKRPEFKDTMLSINVTPLTLLQIKFPKELSGWVEAIGLSSDDIYIEISENTFVHNFTMCQHQLSILKDLGFSIALDDFGKEYSSLSILGRMEFDIIKIDQSFIQHIEEAKNQAIIKMVVDIAKSEDKLVIAEGIEQESQKEILLSLNCYLHQGFYYAHPKKYL